MSLTSRLISDKLRIKNGFLIISAYYSRRSNKSEESDSCYKKVLSPKPNIKEQRIKNFDEGGPNWEIFNPKSNRFYLPNALGPGWQDSSSTISFDVNLKNLIDFDSKESDKLHFSCSRCPTLIRNNMDKLFQFEDLLGKNRKITIITLAYQKHTDIEYGAKNVNYLQSKMPKIYVDNFRYRFDETRDSTQFVIAAQEICRRLHINANWADFMNPFSGKPFFFNEPEKLYTIDKRFRGLGVNYEDLNNCLLISSNADGAFSGSIFTNATHSRDQLVKQLILKEIIEEIEGNDYTDEYKY